MHSGHSACRGQRKVTDPWESESQAVVSCWVCMLGAELSSSLAQELLHLLPSGGCLLITDLSLHEGKFSGSAVCMTFWTGNGGHGPGLYSSHQSFSYDDISVKSFMTFVSLNN